MNRWLRNVLKILVISLWPTFALAFGFGEIKVYSALYQPLLADVPVISADEVSLDDVVVQLASDSVYRQAGVDRKLLGNMRFAWYKANDGKNYLRITTLESLREPYINFLITVDWPKGHLVREFTVLLSPTTTIKAPVVASADLLAAADNSAVSRPVPLPNIVSPTTLPPLPPLNQARPAVASGAPTPAAESTPSDSSSKIAQIQEQLAQEKHSEELLANRLKVEEQQLNAVHAVETPQVATAPTVAPLPAPMPDITPVLTSPQDTASSGYSGFLLILLGLLGASGLGWIGWRAHKLQEAGEVPATIAKGMLDYNALVASDAALTTTPEIQDNKSAFSEIAHSDKAEAIASELSPQFSALEKDEFLIDFTFNNMFETKSEQSAVAAPVSIAAGEELSRKKLEAVTPTAAPLLDEEMTTKLELARLYLDMGDKEGAREMLEEVLGQGNTQQQHDAKELLQRVI